MPDSRAGACDRSNVPDKMSAPDAVPHYSVCVHTGGDELVIVKFRTHGDAKSPDW